MAKKVPAKWSRCPESHLLRTMGLIVYIFFSSRIHTGFLLGRDDVIVCCTGRWAILHFMLFITLLYIVISSIFTSRVAMIVIELKYLLFT